MNHTLNEIPIHYTLDEISLDFINEIHNVDYNTHVNNTNRLVKDTTIKDMIKSTNIKISTNQNIQCPICLEYITKNSISRYINVCLHEFHYTCIEKWLSHNITCPVCRYNIKS